MLVSLNKADNQRLFKRITIATQWSLQHVDFLKFSCSQKLKFLFT